MMPLQNNDVFFVDFAILHRPWLTTWPPGFKEKPHVNCQPSINISTPEHFVDQFWIQKHAGWWYQSTKKKSSFALYIKLLLNVVNKWLDIDHFIWARQHVPWRALREVDWKLFVQIILILNDCLLGMHGPRYCTDLVCSIYLPIMTHSPISLPLHIVCQRQSNIFNSFNFVWSHFNHRLFVLKNKQICTP